MASDVPSSAEEIQRQMQSVRSSLRADVKELVENARDMTDWHYYVRRYPLASMAVAATVGFTLTSLGTQRATSAVQAPAPSPFGETPPAHAPGSPSLMNRLFASFGGMATSAITRAALAIATQQLNKFVADSSFLAPTGSAPSAAQEEHSHVQSNR